jgi:hypothetical protein
MRYFEYKKDFCGGSLYCCSLRFLFLYVHWHKGTNDIVDSRVDWALDKIKAKTLPNFRLRSIFFKAFSGKWKKVNKMPFVTFYPI